MASELLAIPEELLVEVIRVIHAGLLRADVSNRTRVMLDEWCDEMSE